MKKKIIVCILTIFIIILFFCCYKFLDIGNTKNIENVDELDKYIQAINDYELEAKVVVNSNKNSNEYMLKQKNSNGTQIQEIFDEENSGIVIENTEGKVNIKNTKLSLEKVIEKFDGVVKNSFGLDAFIEDYKADSKKEFLDENDYYIVSVKSKNSQNKYSKSKVMYFNKRNNSIEKIVIKDINNNEMVVIEYINLEIL